MTHDVSIKISSCNATNIPYVNKSAFDMEKKGISLEKSKKYKDKFASTNNGYCFPCHQEQLAQALPILAKMFEWIEYPL